MTSINKLIGKENKLGKGRGYKVIKVEKKKEIKSFTHSRGSRVLSLMASSTNAFHRLLSPASPLQSSLLIRRTPSSHLIRNLPSSLPPFGLRFITLRGSRLSSILATCPAHLNFDAVVSSLSQVTLVIYLIPALCLLLHLPSSPSCTGPQILSESCPQTHPVSFPSPLLSPLFPAHTLPLVLSLPHMSVLIVLVISLHQFFFFLLYKLLFPLAVLSTTSVRAAFLQDTCPPRYSMTSTYSNFSPLMHTSSCSPTSLSFARGNMVLSTLISNPTSLAVLLVAFFLDPLNLPQLGHRHLQVLLCIFVILSGVILRLSPCSL